MRSVKDKFDGLTIFVMNVESYSISQGPEGRAVDGSDALGAWGMIAIDESTTIKNHKAKRTKALMKMLLAVQVQKAVDRLSHNKKSNGYLFAVRVPPPWALGFRIILRIPRSVCHCAAQEDGTSRLPTDRRVP